MASASIAHAGRLDRLPVRLTLSAYASAMAGDGNDLYAWDYGGPALTLGAEFVF